VWATGRPLLDPVPPTARVLEQPRGGGTKLGMQRRSQAAACVARMQTEKRLSRIKDFKDLRPCRRPFALPHSEPADSFDELARHRLLERRALLEQHVGRRPPHGGPVGWVHGDFHPFNLLYRGDAPAAIVDWDRLGVKPRAEEAVRAAAIFFVRPAGALDLPKVRAYARAYRRAAGATPSELTAAVHRVWWERLNDFWMLRWHYERGDTRADPQFPAASALVVWWTREYDAVCDAFVD